MPVNDGAKKPGEETSSALSDTFPANKKLVMKLKTTLASSIFSVMINSYPIISTYTKKNSVIKSKFEVFGTGEMEN